MAKGRTVFQRWIMAMLLASGLLAWGQAPAEPFLVKTRASDGGPWEGPFLWLHRYQKVAQGWKLVSRFHTTEGEQLEGLVQALRQWGLIS